MKDKILERLESCGAIQRGSFILSSGRISDTYVQLFKLLDHPDTLEWLCQQLAEMIAEHPCDILLAPALGAMIPGYLVSAKLHSAFNKPHRYMFCERVNGVFELRRGFVIKPDEKVWILENVITTGKSAREAMALAHGYRADIAGLATLIDRGGCAGFKDEGLNVCALAYVDACDYDAAEAPKKLLDMGPIKPGSRV